jgi:hypothetical protein
MRKALKKSKAECCADEVLLEIWRIKDKLSAARGHSVEKLFADTREHEKISAAKGWKIVSSVPRRDKNVRASAKKK